MVLLFCTRFAAKRKKSEERQRPARADDIDSALDSSAAYVQSGWTGHKRLTMHKRTTATYNEN